MTLGVAGAKGFWDALFFLYIVWAAFFLYEVVRSAGVFEVFREDISAFTSNRLVQFLAFGIVFVLFLQASAGFGTPIAVVAPILVSLGLRPLYAVALALIGHVWGDSFGSLAISWIAMQLVVEVSQPTIVVTTAAILLALAVAFSVVTLVWYFGGAAALTRGWLLMLVLAAVYGLGQLAIAPFIPELAAVVPATVALGVVFLVPRVLPGYAERMEYETNPQIMQEGTSFAEAGGEDSDGEREAGPEAAGNRERQLPPLLIGFVPYYGLVVFAILGLALTELVEPLGQLEIGLRFPPVETGYGIVQEGTDVYSGLNPIGHPGTYILLSALVGYFVFRARSYLEGTPAADLLMRTQQNAVPPSVAIVGFLTLAQVMDHSGQTFVLAQGIAEVAPAFLYPAAAAFIGILGAFITSSNTASNILFSPLHQQAATTLGIGDGVVLGAQMAGGAFGNAIAPANVALGTGTTGISGQEGAVLRITLVWTAIMGVLGALVAVAIQLAV